MRSLKFLKEQKAPWDQPPSTVLTLQIRLHFRPRGLRRIFVESLNFYVGQYTAKKCESLDDFELVCLTCRRSFVACDST